MRSGSWRSGSGGPVSAMATPSSNTCPACAAVLVISAETGMLVCQSCGFLSQDFVMEEEDYENFVPLRRDRQAKVPRMVEETVEDQRYRMQKEEEQAQLHSLGVTAEAYVEGLQVLLIKYTIVAMEMVEGKGVGELMQTVKELFLAYVESSGILTSGFTYSVRKNLKGFTRKRLSARRRREIERKRRENPDQAHLLHVDTELDSSSDDADEEADDVADFELRKEATRKGEYSIIGSELNKAFPQSDLICLLYIACLWLRLPLLLSDLVRGTLTGELKFLNAHSVLEERIALAVPLPAFAPKTVPNVAYFHKRVAFVQDQLRVATPPVNVPWVLERLCRRLRLPKWVGTWAGRLFDVHEVHSMTVAPSSAHFKLKSRGSGIVESAYLTLPDVWIVSAILVALKLAYGFGRRSSWQQELSEETRKSVEAAMSGWAEAVIDELPRIALGSFSKELQRAIASKGDEDTVRFYAECHNVLLPADRRGLKDEKRHGPTYLQRDEKVANYYIWRLKREEEKKKDDTKKKKKPHEEEPFEFPDPCAGELKDLQVYHPTEYFGRDYRRDGLPPLGTVFDTVLMAIAFYINVPPRIISRALYKWETSMEASEELERVQPEKGGGVGRKRKRETEKGKEKEDTCYILDNDPAAAQCSRPRKAHARK